MTFHRILVPLDGSSLAEEALPHALRLARAFDAQLLLLHVLDVQPSIIEHCPDSPDWRLRRMQAQRYLETVAARIGAQAQGVAIVWHLAEGRAAGRILEFVRAHEVGLVVMCAYGWGGVSEFPFGGTAHKIVVAAEASYAIIRPGASELSELAPYRRVLVPLDGSRRAEWAIGLATSIVRDAPAEIVLLQIVPAPTMPRRRPLTREELDLRARIVECNRREAAAYLSDVKAHLGDGERVRTRLMISTGVAETIHRVAEEEQADLIALTAHGASDQGERNLGPICHALLTRSKRPLLIFQDARRQARPDLGSMVADGMERKICAPRR